MGWYNLKVLEMAFIKAISYYLPETVLTNEALVKEFPEWSVEKVAQKVGVNTRHLSSENETACDMAEKAARKPDISPRYRLCIALYSESRLFPTFDIMYSSA